MNVFLTGASGLVGTALSPRLREAGHQVTALVRRKPRDVGERQWDPTAGQLPVTLLDGCDALIHLAGDNIGAGRWTAAKKQRVRESRVQGTELLAKLIHELDHPPQTLIVASAVGYYGDRGDEVLTESSAPGTGFLPDVCQAWESAADAARSQGVRIVHLRLGMILSPQGGALAKMLLPFRMGVGGIVGSGKQYWSWITLDDAVRLFVFALQTDELSGPVNAVSPNSVTNYDFTKTLGQVLKRPTLIPLPTFAARLGLGEMADGLLLASARVTPDAALRHGFEFRHAELESGLRAVLDRS